MLTLNLTPVDSLLYSSDVAAIASFRCPASHPLFRDSGPIGNPLFVFPRTAVAIRHDSGRPFVSDPNLIPLYNRKQVYSRMRVSDIDASDWYAVADDVLLEAIAAYDPHVYDHAERPFRTSHVPASMRMYLAQRQLFDRLSSGSPADGLRVEEAVIQLLDGVLRQIYGSAKKEAIGASARESVETVRLAIARGIDRRFTLRQLARHAGQSPFALCRAFAHVTGMTITAYRHSLRLRVALERLEGADDLTTIALDLGYSSHSHFTLAFRRAFGMTPSAYRAQRSSGGRVTRKRAAPQSPASLTHAPLL